MANKLITGNSFSTGDQVTSTKLNASINSATFDSGAVDDSTTAISSGAIIVKDAGITPAKISTGGPSWDSSGNVSVSESISVPDGSESVPSITNTGDTNTGIYFPDENSVALTAGAGAKLTCSTSAITIERPTTIVSTAQTELTLQGGDSNSKNLIFQKASAQQGKISAVGDELKFYAGTSATETLELTTTEAVVTGDLTVDTTTLKVDSTNNRVGIGTASPTKKLHIASDANGQTTADIPGIRIENTDTTALDTNVSGEIEFFSKDASEADKISGFIKNVAEDAGTKYALTFGAKATGSNAAEAMRIDNAGLVGIGTSAPSAPLEVSSTTGGVIMPRMTTTQKNAISSPTNGEMVYDTTDNKFYGYANGSWVAFH